jgi:hypothetical protein
MAAGVLFPSGALACEATAQFTGPDVTSVDVVCDEPTPYVINTDYRTFLENELDFDYDGTGDDTISVLGGDVRIQQNESEPYPAFVIETLDGNDTFTMTSGNVIGENSPGGEGPSLPPPVIQLDMGNGDDLVDISGGIFDGAIFLGDGNDTANISGGEIGPIFAGAGNDAVTVSGTAQIGVLTGGESSTDSVGLEDGDDTFTMTGGTLDGGVSGNAGNDTISISGGLVTAYVAGNEDNDTISISGTATIGEHITADEGDDSVSVSGGTVTLFVNAGIGNDSLEISGGSIGSDIFAGDGDDEVDITGGDIGGSIFGDEEGAGNDTISISGGSIAGAVFAGGGNDTVTVSGLADIGFLAGGGSSADSVGLEDGDDTFTMTGGTLNGGVSGNAGNDTISISGGLVAAYVAGNEDNDTISISGTATIGEHVTADEGDDVVSVSGGTITLFVNAGVGTDSVEISGGSIGSDVFAGGGDDEVEITGGDIGGSVSGEAGADSLTIGGGTIGGDVLAGDGNDTINISAGDIGGSIFGDDEGVGNDTISIGGGTIAGAVFAGGGNDAVTVSGTAEIGFVAGGGSSTDSVGLEDGDDTFTMTGGTLEGGVSGNAGNDTISISGGLVTAYVAGNTDNDTISISGTATIGEHVTADEGDDVVSVSGGTITLFVNAGIGNDSVEISGGSIGSDVFAGGGDDEVEITGGDIGGSVSGEAGVDSLTVGGGTIGGDVLAGDGGDTINILAGDIGGSISGGAGADVMAVSGGTGTIDGGVLGGDDNDTVDISGGDIDGSVSGGAGTDVITVSGGTIGGGVEGETIELFGGTIEGDITGISGNTLVVEAGTSLNLRDGVLFQGTDAVGTITDTDLARAEGTSFDSQNFAGFSSLGVDGSTIGFSGPTQTIDELSLIDDSTLFVAGQINQLATGGGAGDLSVVNSTINMINGDPTDRLNVGNITLDTATLAIDINQETIQADQLVASGLFDASGDNVILVNLLGAPQFSGVSIIPIAPIEGETVDSGATGSELFTVDGITGTPGSLFTYDVVTGSDGGVYLRALPSDLVSPQATRVAIDSRPIENVTETVSEISDDAISDIMELPKGSGRSDAGPGFGVYASGQLARVNHEGFTVSGDSLSALGPSFSANDFSLAASLELDVAKYYGFDDTYGLNVGLFGGYATSDVTLDPINGFEDVGDAQNESGMFGGYGLFRSGTSYALISATTFVGETEIDNHVLGAAGEYDTVGYAFTGSVGHIFMLTETLRFDLRGGALWASFEGDAFEDSEGNSFGESQVSFGAIKFEPGIYGDFNLDNGMAFSPYGRLELQQRLGYENTGSVEGLDFEFEDADFSASLSAGFNLRVTQTTTLSSEIRTKFSSDSETFAGKLGLKVKF